MRVRLFPKHACRIPPGPVPDPEVLVCQSGGNGSREDCLRSRRDFAPPCKLFLTENTPPHSVGRMPAMFFLLSFAPPTLQGPFSDLDDGCESVERLEWREFERAGPSKARYSRARRPCRWARAVEPRIWFTHFSTPPMRLPRSLRRS